MGALKKFNKSLQDPFMSVHSHGEPHPKSWNYSLSWLKKRKKNRRMTCNFWTRKAMFIFQKPTPWRRDCHAGLKSRQKAHRRMSLGHSTPSTRHLSPGARGCSCYLSDTEQCHGFPCPNTSWRWRLPRSRGSGGRPGMCSAPAQPSPAGAAGPAWGAAIRSWDMSRPARMGHRVKGL